MRACQFKKTFMLPCPVSSVFRQSIVNLVDLHGPSVANIGFYTAEKGPSKIWATKQSPTADPPTPLGQINIYGRRRYPRHRAGPPTSGLGMRTPGITLCKIEFPWIKPWRARFRRYRSRFERRYSFCRIFQAQQELYTDSKLILFFKVCQGLLRYTRVYIAGNKNRGKIQKEVKPVSVKHM